MQARRPRRSSLGRAPLVSAPPIAARARRACRAGASLGIVEHGVDLRVGELEVLTDRDRAGKRAMCREEARPRRRWLHANEARDRDAVARDLHLFPGFYAGEELGQLRLRLA